MVIEAVKGYAAMQAGDPATCAVVAAECEEFATAEGVPVVCAEASFLWLAAPTAPTLSCARSKDAFCTNCPAT